MLQWLCVSLALALHLRVNNERWRKTKSAQSSSSKITTSSYLLSTAASSLSSSLFQTRPTDYVGCKKWTFLLLDLTVYPNLPNSWCNDHCCLALAGCTALASLLVLRFFQRWVNGCWMIIPSPGEVNVLTATLRAEMVPGEVTIQSCFTSQPCRFATTGYLCVVLFV